MKSALRLMFAVAWISMLLAAPAICSPLKLKEEMRQPWRPETFIRHWLVLGEFPNVDRKGMDVDYLTEHGGEAQIRPVVGMSHKRPDGSAAVWTDYTSDEDAIDFLRVLAGRPRTNSVAYAYTTIERPAAGKVVLSLGSDDGVEVWVNGKRAHQNLASRGVTADDDMVEVTLSAGTNHVLLKVDQSVGGWGFIFRVREPGAFPLRAIPLQATVKAGDGNLLLLATNSAEDASPVQFEVMAAGGRILAKRMAARGVTVSIDTAKWPDAPYEVRVSTEKWPGRREYAYVPWYKGDLLAALKQLVAMAPQGTPATPEAGHHQMLAEMVKDRMQGDMNSLPGKRIPVLQSILLEYAELLQQDKSKGGPAHASGFVRLAYIDDTDGSTQFCRAYLPAAYDASRRWPLVIALHGHHQQNPVYVRWWSVDARHNALVDRHDIVLVEPHGRGNTSYQGIGERDVMRCVQLAKERFRIDDDRAYLTGQSMGGGGTWYVGSRHPELFAAIAPVFGGWDYHVGLSEDQLAKLTPRERYLQETRSSFAQADALLNTPVFVNHGDADPIVPVDNSRYAVRMLQRWGYNVVYREHPGKGHGGMGNDDEMVEWLLQHKRTLYPRQVRVRAAELSSAAAFWVRVNQRKDERDFMVAQAEVVAPNTIRLETKNVLAVTLSPGSPLVDPSQPLSVFWNSAGVRRLTLKDGRVTLFADGYVPARREKSAEIAGPISQVMHSPFAIVVGTIAADPMTRELCRRKAQDVADYWMRSQHQSPRLFKDTEIAEGDLSRYSLILIGGNEANAITRKLAASLPVKISGSTISIDGRTFQAPDAAVMLVYPNPLNPAHYVLLAASSSPEGMFFADLLRDDLGAYDFVITDGAVPSSRRGRMPEKIRLAAGWFDRHWRTSGTLLDEADPAARAAAPVLKVRPDLTTYVTKGKEVRPEILDSYVGKYEGRQVRAEVKRAGTELALYVPNQEPVPLVAISDNEFDLIGVDAALTFVRDAQGKVTHAAVEPSSYPAFNVTKIN